MQQLTEKRLVSDCISGKKEAFRELYHKYAPFLMGICLRYCNNADAEDVLQDSLIKIFQSIGKFSYQSDIQFKAWLKTITVNTALNFIKVQNKITFIHDYEIEKSDFSTDLFYDEQEEPDDIFSSEELLAFISKLPIGYRTVFNLYVFENKSHKEISDMLGITENTSKTQLFKARKFLKTMLFNKINALQYEKRY